MAKEDEFEEIEIDNETVGEEVPDPYDDGGAAEEAIERPAKTSFMKNPMFIGLVATVVVGVPAVIMMGDTSQPNTMRNAAPTPILSSPVEAEPANWGVMPSVNKQANPLAINELESAIEPSISPIVSAVTPGPAPIPVPMTDPMPMPEVFTSVVDVNDTTMDAMVFPTVPVANEVYEEPVQEAVVPAQLPVVAPVVAGYTQADIDGYQASIDELKSLLSERNAAFDKLAVERDLYRVEVSAFKRKANKEAKTANLLYKYDWTVKAATPINAVVSNPQGETLLLRKGDKFKGGVVQSIDYKKMIVKTSLGVIGG